MLRSPPYRTGEAISACFYRDNEESNKRSTERLEPINVLHPARALAYELALNAGITDMRRGKCFISAHVETICSGCAKKKKYTYI